MFVLLLLLIATIAVGLSTYSRFIALLFLIPLSVYAQSATVFSIGERGVNLGMDTIYIFILVLMEFARGDNKFKKNLNRTSFALLLCFVYFFFNSLMSSFTGPNGFSLSGIIVYIRLFQYVPIFILICNLNINFKQSIQVINVFIFTGVSAAILSGYQLFSGNYSYMKGMPSFTMPIFRELGVVTEDGMYAGSANYNVYAAFLLIPIFLGILLWYSRKELKGIKKIIFLILILLIGMYISSSRAALLAILIGVISINFNLKRILPSLKPLLIIFISIFMLGYFFREQVLIKNFTDIIFYFKDALPYAMDNVAYDSNMGFSGDTLGAVVRVFGYMEAIRVFILYPIFGCGFGLFLTQSIHYPENLFLQILAETGIVGFWLYSVFIFRLYKDAMKLPMTNKFNKYYILTFQAIILALMFVNMTGATLLIQKVWGPFLIIAGFFYAYQRTTVKDLNFDNEE
jgi:O-antigen ligase